MHIHVQARRMEANEECVFVNAVCISQRHMVFVSRASAKWSVAHIWSVCVKCATNQCSILIWSDRLAICFPFCLNHCQVESLKNQVGTYRYFSFLCFCFKHSYPRMGRTVSHMKRFQWIKRAQNNERTQNKESSAAHERLDDDRAYANVLTESGRKIDTCNQNMQNQNWFCLLISKSATTTLVTATSVWVYCERTEKWVALIPSYNTNNRIRFMSGCLC